MVSTSRTSQHQNGVAPEPATPHPPGQVGKIQFKLVNLADIEDAPHNPSRRTDSKSLPLKRLQESIESVGLIYPVLVAKQTDSDKFRLVDGHRRKAACTSLGWTAIPAIVRNEDPDLTYGQVNGTSMRLNTNDELHVFLDNPNALAQHVRAKYENLERKVGRQFLERLRQKNLSPVLVDRANRLCGYLGDQRPEMVKKTAEWMLATGMNFRVRTIMELGTPPAKILKAIRSNKPLTMTYTSK